MWGPLHQCAVPIGCCSTLFPLLWLMEWNLNNTSGIIEYCLCVTCPVPSLCFNLEICIYLTLPCLISQLHALEHISTLVIIMINPWINARLRRLLHVRASLYIKRLIRKEHERNRMAQDQFNLWEVFGICREELKWSVDQLINRLFWC